MLSSRKPQAHATRVSKQLRDARLGRPAAEILAELAHEMRQPLSAAIAAAMLLRPACSDARTLRAWEVLDRQFRRLSRLVEDVSDSTRSRLTVRRLAIEYLDLRRVVEEALDGIRPLVAGKRQRLHTTLPVAPVWVRADWVRLHQVLSNLFLNAVKYTPRDGIIKVHLEQHAATAVLAVSDTGRGISSHQLATMFHPFVTGDRPSGHGLGVGLAVARRFVELHGGTIRASSPGPGGGSEFVVTLPLAAHRPGESFRRRPRGAA